MKPEIRILGFDDAPFVPRSQGKTIVIGVITRGGKYPDGIIKTEVTIDGMDATETLSNVVNKSKHKQQLQAIMLNGITMAGFNVVNIYKFYKHTNLPIIAINRKNPNLERIRKALKNFSDFNERWEAIKAAGKISRVEVRPGKVIYYQCAGIENKEAEEIIKLTCTRSLIPEPLRLAHLIASALVKGESGGRA
jgi:hypothetical protein